jgi:predicted transposase/invertase (TIGR01784 family)
VVVDTATQEVVEKRSRFIEMLHHKCWIIQISCLKQRRRNELEKLLHIFDQSNRTSDYHILNVREEDFPEKFRPLIRRLQMAASDNEVKQKMEQEDIHLRYVQNVERAAHHKGLAEGLEKGEAIGLEKGELNKAITIALKLLKKDMPVEEISDTTGLSIQQIEELISNQQNLKLI